MASGFKTLAHKQDLSIPWIATQHKTFTRWCNIFLKRRKVESVELKGIVTPADLSSGYNLILLLEELSGKAIFRNEADKRAAKKPSKFQHLDNITRALNFIKTSEKIVIENIGPADIVDGNLKLTLGLVWSLIMKYQILAAEYENASRSMDEAKSQLLAWVNSKITPLGASSVNNFGKDWNDGVALSALVEAISPGSLDFDQVQVNKSSADGRIRNGKQALGIATDKLEIPELLDVEDLICLDPDELSLMTYISVFKETEANIKDRVLSKEEQEARRIAEAARSLKSAEEEAERKRKEEEDRKRREAEEEAARKRREAEEDAARKKRDEEDAKRRQEEEDRRRKQQEEDDARRLKALEEDKAREAERQKREAEEAAKLRSEKEDAERRKREAEAAEKRVREEEERLRKLEEEVRKRKEEVEDAARKRREEEDELRKQRWAEEEALRNKRLAEEDASRKRREEEEAARRKRDEDERNAREAEEQRKLEEAEAKRKREEEEAKRKREEEEARRKREEEEARRKRDAEEAEQRRGLEMEEEAQRRKEEEEANRRRKEEEERRRKEQEEEERRRKEEEEERKRRQAAKKAAKRKAKAEKERRAKELQDLNKEGEGTKIFPAPPDKIKNRRGGCFVCEVHKDLGRKHGKLVIRGYLANLPVAPGGPIEVETELIQKVDPKFMKEKGKRIEVWTETKKGTFHKTHVRHIVEKDIDGLLTFDDTHFQWMLPSDLEISSKNIKHTLCMDIGGVDRKGKLKFRWPIEEVSKSQSVIHRSFPDQQKSSAPPAKGSVAAMLADRKGNKPAPPKEETESDDSSAESEEEESKGSTDDSSEDDSSEEESSEEESSEDKKQESSEESSDEESSEEESSEDESSDEESSEDESDEESSEEESSDEESSEEESSEESD